MGCHFSLWNIWPYKHWALLQHSIFLPPDVLHKLRYKPYPLQHDVIKVGEGGVWGNIPGTDLIMRTVLRFRDRFRRVFGCGKSLILNRKRSATQSHTSSTRWNYVHINNKKYINTFIFFSNLCDILFICRFSNSLSHKVENQNQGWSEKLQGKQGADGK